jgi:hypothetical protein
MNECGGDECSPPALARERSGRARVGRRNEEWALWQINKEKTLKTHSIIIYFAIPLRCFPLFAYSNPSSKVERIIISQRRKKSYFSW